MPRNKLYAKNYNDKIRLHYLVSAIIPHIIRVVLKNRYSRCVARLKGEIERKNLLAGGFLFTGGAILMSVAKMGDIVPFLGAGCALIGVGMLLYYVFSDNGKYND